MEVDLPFTAQTTADVVRIGPDIYVDAQIGANGRPKVSIIAPKDVHLQRIPRRLAPEPFCNGPLTRGRG